MRRILVVMDSEILISLPESDYELTRCNDICEAAKLLSQQFDGLVMNLFLPGTDGLAFLEAVQSQLPSVVLLLSPFLSPYVLQSAASLCGGYVLPIPSSDEEICHRLEDMFQKYNSPVSVCVASVRYHLHRIGLSPARKGYHCAAYILPTYNLKEDPCLNKDYYPALTEQYAVTPAAIDNALHREIQRAYQNRNDAIWQEYFPDTSRCPSNKEFLSAVAAKIQ